MNTMNEKQKAPGRSKSRDFSEYGPGLKELFTKIDPVTAWILFIVPVLLTVWVYFGKQAVFVRFFPAFEGRWNQDFYSTLYEYLSAFVCMFVIPLIFVRFVFKERLADYGLQSGDYKAGLKILLMLAPLLMLTAYFAASGGDMQAEYPLSKLVIPVAA